MGNQEQKDPWLKNFFQFGEVFKYFFRNKEPDKKPDVNLQLMHVINKLSIIIFIIAILILIGRQLFR